MDRTFMFITFETTHKAIAFENKLIDDFDIELIPTPREVTASCGLALKFNESDQPQILDRISGEDFKDIKLYYYLKHFEKTQVVHIKWEVAYAT